MNKEEILAMEAGRELDALVGERVMGLYMVEGRLPQLPKHYHPDYDRTIFQDVPLYSSDISAAWEVLDKLKETHDHIGIYFSQCIGKEWTGSITDLSEQTDEEGDFYVKDISADAETAQLAICRLSLLAVME